VLTRTPGFFFWGIMLLPIAKPSSRVIDWNSQLAHRISSSARRLKVENRVAELLRASSMKSRLLVASRECSWIFYVSGQKILKGRENTWKPIS
jgi:hypothetical protein